MFDNEITIGSMVWTVIENDEPDKDEDYAPAPMCMAARAEMLATWYADLAAHAERERRIRFENSPEEIRRRADAVYDAIAARTRANGMHMM